MGISPFHLSGSVYDRDYVKPAAPPPLPNPNPERFNIIKHEQVGGYLCVLVNYPDCTNFEGNKIMVYEGVTVHQLQWQSSLDPHFSDNGNYHSPIARFVPTEDGWKMARLFCKTMGEQR